MSTTAALSCALVYWIIYVLDYGFLSWQCLIRPIVVAPIIGLVLGDPTTGIVMGASLEAIFMGISAVGGSVPSDCLSGTIIAVAYAILVGGDEAVETGLALALTIGTIMASANSMLMALWGSLAAYWEKLAGEAKPKKFFAINVIVYMVAALIPSAIIYLGVAFGVNGLQSALNACPAWVMTGLSTAGTMMTAIGFGILLSQIWSGDIAIFFFVGFVLSKSLGLSSLGVAIIAAAVALLYFVIEKDVVSQKRGVVLADKSEDAKTAPVNAPANTEEDFF